MLKLGIISELGDGENLGYARVNFDEQDIVSPWLALPSCATKTAKHWLPFELGAQVAVIMDKWCDQGYVACELWSDTDVPPDWASKNTIGMKFADGAEMYYDSENKKFIVNAPESEADITCKKATISCEDGITLKISDLTCELDGSSNKVGIGNGSVTLLDLLTLLKDIITTLKVNTPAGPSMGLLPDSIQKLVEFETKYKQLVK